MYADLMRAAGIDFDLDQSEFSEWRVQSAQGFVVRHGFPTSGVTSGHPYAANTIAADAG